MSKKIKILLAVGVVVFLSVGSFVLLRPKKDEGLVEKEISIKQAEVPSIDTLIYKDSAGFAFEYPSLLTVREVEIEDETIYSSLELTDSDDRKLLIKVADSDYDTTDEWQEVFEETNVISQIEKVMITDIPAIKFMFEAPIVLKTVGVENKIIYSIENVADNGGFFDQAHGQILDSFVFDDEVYGETLEPAGKKSNEVADSEDVVLLEEILE